MTSTNTIIRSLGRNKLGAAISLGSKLARPLLPNPNVGADLQTTIATGAIDLQFEQIVSRFPAGFGPLGMGGARGDADPIAAHLDAVCVLMAEQMHSGDVVQKIP